MRMTATERRIAEAVETAKYEHAKSIAEMKNELQGKIDFLQGKVDSKKLSFSNVIAVLGLGVAIYTGVSVTYFNLGTADQRDREFAQQKERDAEQDRTNEARALAQRCADDDRRAVDAIKLNPRSGNDVIEKVAAANAACELLGVPLFAKFAARIERDPAGIPPAIARRTKQVRRNVEKLASSKWPIVSSTNSFESFIAQNSISRRNFRGIGGNGAGVNYGESPFPEKIAPTEPYTTQQDDPLKQPSRWFDGAGHPMGFETRGLGPKVRRLDATVDDAVGGPPSNPSRIELAIPLGKDAKSLGLGPSIFVDAGSVFRVGRGAATKLSNVGTQF